MRGRMLAIVLALLTAAAVAAWVPAARAAGVDGISDQSLAEWDGALRAGGLAGELRAPLFAAAVGPETPAGGISLARYVVQWDALLPGHDEARYRERFEAWLSRVAGLGLRPVLALTSYDGRFPPSPQAYAAGLRALLHRALGLGRPIAFLEPWNEPNGQGHADPRTAAAYADAARVMCGAPTCTLIAGDIQDRAGAPEYARAYARALAFVPEAWGIHPYGAVARRDLAPLLALRAALPASAAHELWITEIAALRCRRGVVFGERRQAQDAAFLVDRVVPAVHPVHVLYYGLQLRSGQQPPCSPAGGEDGELFAPDGTPRPAAAIVFPALAASVRAGVFGPLPGA